MKIACTVWSGGKDRDNFKVLPITIKRTAWALRLTQKERALADSRTGGLTMANVNLPAMLNSEGLKNRFSEVLGKNAAGFMSALLNIYNSNTMLQNCEPRSILGAAGLAATLNLSITPSLGQAYIVPFKGKAQFQVGVRGLVQLAHRTGKYAALHAGKVYEGELRGFDPFTGTPERGEKTGDRR